MLTLLLLLIGAALVVGAVLVLVLAFWLVGSLSVRPQKRLPVASGERRAPMLRGQFALTGTE